MADRIPPDAFPPLSEAELDALAAEPLTPAAQQSAQRAFRRQAPKDRQSLLDATDADTEPSGGNG